MALRVLLILFCSPAVIASITSNCSSAPCDCKACGGAGCYAGCGTCDFTDKHLVACCKYCCCKDTGPLGPFPNSDFPRGIPEPHNLNSSKLSPQHLRGANFIPPTVEWSTPASEPSKNMKGATIIGGGMPIGNGETTAYVFPIQPGTPAKLPDTDFELGVGVGLTVSMATAMASDTTLLGLGMITLQTTPCLFSGDHKSSFKQVLDTADASVTVSTDVGSVKVWVDASTNAVRAICSASNKTKSLSLSVRVQSLHPSHNFTYGGGFSTFGTMAQPDAFSPDKEHSTVQISHRNLDSDQPAAFNDTLEQQGLGSLVEQLQGSDRWRGRHFGMKLGGDHLALTGVASLASCSPQPTFELVVTTLAAQTSTPEEFEARIQKEYKAQCSHSLSYEKHHAWWSEFWSRSFITVGTQNQTRGPALAALNNKYALTRYVQAIQASGNTWVPIKFNGYMFTTQLPPETTKSGPSFRDWGANNWWQNTRLPYGPMLGAGDFDGYRNVLNYYLQMLDVATARTRLYFNHSGIFFTETKTLFGTFSPSDYGQPASTRNASTIPVYLESNGYIHYDYGGDGGTTEIATMVLDYYEYTGDVEALLRYSPIVLEAVEFFRQHYPMRRLDSTNTSRMVIFPTQSLETYWCAWENPTGVPWAKPDNTNCLSDDHPTVASLHVLLERSLRLLPSSVLPPTQRVHWVDFQAILPPIPLIEEDGVVRTSPYATYPANRAIHNSETPELYSVHPFRYFSVGRKELGGRDISPAVQCLTNSSRPTCTNGHTNSGWSQGIMDAALLGLSDIAQGMVLGRSSTAPATGYRFSVFAPHEQDYEPSADHYAVMNMALQWMLLQPADDKDQSAMLFGAWPCDWDVDFKLRAPANTTVEGSFAKGQLVSLTVAPESRKPFVHVMPCGGTSKAAAHHTPGLQPSQQGSSLAPNK